MKMLSFDNIEDLVSYMFDHLDDEDAHVSVIANKEMVIGVMHELLNYENVMLTSCEIDYAADYDKEYIVSLSYNGISDKWYVSIEKGYLVEKAKYLAIGGYVLFHEDVNSKAMIDLQNNEFMPLGKHDWFTIGEEEDSDVDDEEDNTENSDSDTETNDEGVDSGYSVTVKVDLDTDEAEKLIRDMEKDMRRELSGMFDMLYRPYLYEYHPSPIRFFW